LLRLMINNRLLLLVNDLLRLMINNRLLLLVNDWLLLLFYYNLFLNRSWSNNHCII
jgi:hypothetical protein